MVCGRCIKHPSTDSGGEVCTANFLRFRKTWCTSQIFLHSRMSVRNLFIFQLSATRTKTETWKYLKSYEYWRSLEHTHTPSGEVRRGDYYVDMLTFHLLSTQHSVHRIPSLRMGGGLSGKMQREITYFLASGKNYFYTISYLLMNQAHISKGGRVESLMASLQGVLEVCRTNLPPLSPQTIKLYMHE